MTACHYVNILGANIRCRQVGEGPDIFFIHGLSGSIETWQPIVDELSGRYRLTLYDRPGFGLSTVTRNYTLEQNAQVARMLIEKFRLDNPLVVGHSFGGGIAVALATSQPPEICGFVGAGALVYPGLAVPMVSRILTLPVIGKPLVRLVTKLPGTMVMSRSLPEVFGPNEDLVPEGYVETRARLVLTPATLTYFCRESARVNGYLQAMSRNYHKITHPLTLVHGTGDRIAVCARQSQAFHAAYPATRLILMENTGHMLQFVRTRELAAIIAEHRDAL